jgi:hypothetical protein
MLAGLGDESFTQNCTPPAIDDFPKDLFTEEQRQDGAVVLHVIASLYLFVGLAVVCDKYFVPAVERICQGTAARHVSLILNSFRQLLGLRQTFAEMTSQSNIPAISKLYLENNFK